MNNHPYGAITKCSFIWLNSLAVNFYSVAFKKVKRWRWEEEEQDTNRVGSEPSLSGAILS